MKSDAYLSCDVFVIVRSRKVWCHAIRSSNQISSTVFLTKHNSHWTLPDQGHQDSPARLIRGHLLCQCVLCYPSVIFYRLEDRYPGRSLFFYNSIFLWYFIEAQSRLYITIHTVFSTKCLLFYLYLSVGPETRLEARIQALEALSAQKAPVGVLDQDGVNKRE